MFIVLYNFGIIFILLYNYGVIFHQSFFKSSTAFVCLVYTTRHHHLSSRPSVRGELEWNLTLGSLKLTKQCKAILLLLRLSSYKEYWEGLKPHSGPQCSRHYRWALCRCHQVKVQLESAQTEARFCWSVRKKPRQLDYVYTSI